MIAQLIARAGTKMIVPEVIQTSMMDCGPAALKCALEGFGIPVSYGRLREACQTSIDGTSIDTLEQVANQLGLDAEQVMLPVDHVFLDEADALPAILVIKRSDGAAHFVVVWSRIGNWLQVMDPSVGRRWVSIERFKLEVFLHSMPVSALDWFDWAKTAAFTKPLEKRLQYLGVPSDESKRLIQQSLSSVRWQNIATLDASVRLVTHIVDAGGVDKGATATHLVEQFYDLALNTDADIFNIIPAVYWSVSLDTVLDETANLNKTEETIQLHGAVLIKLQGQSEQAINHTLSSEEQNVELANALKEPTPNPIQTLWSLLKEDGLLAPMALILAMCMSAGIVLIQMLLFKGLFDVGWSLNLPVQRVVAVAALLVFVGILLSLEIPIGKETMRMGRHLEIRLRLALLEKLPKLPDRYFQSRPVSDMAERSHSIYVCRLVPSLGLHFIQSFCSVCFTLLGLTLIDSNSIYAGLAIIVVSVVSTLLIQPFLNERDLRVRTHVGAMNSFYLDALIGAVPISTHQAQKVVIRQHESLLVSWIRSSIGMVRVALLANAVQSLLCLGIAANLIYQHFLGVGGVSGSDLLLIFWTLRLPAISKEFTMLTHQYPAQRNMLLRLIEPLTTPETPHEAVKSIATTDVVKPPTANLSAADIHIKSGDVVAGGHVILQDIELSIKPGEHIAVVGSSGAGKSTLVGLLLGWHRLTAGEILVDGQPLDVNQLAALRQSTAWVDPSVQIWNRSFLDNLTYAVDDMEGQFVHHAIDRAQLNTVLEKLPAGLQSYLGEGGGLLSGGEGQRVRLARALMQQDVRLALLDEPFRGLDRQQRKLLLKNACDWWKNSTLICVTHDVSETLQFSRVLVIENGYIVEDGHPQTLAAQTSRYKDLLDAENTVRDAMWEDDTWRKLKVEHGQLKSNDVQKKDVAAQSIHLAGSRP